MTDGPGTLTRVEIADVVQRGVGISRSESLQMVERIIEHMREALAKGENVKIAGFGTFLLNDKPERIGRNPRTGVEAQISARRVLTFRASQVLRDRVSRPLHAR